MAGGACKVTHHPLSLIPPLVVETRGWRREVTLAPPVSSHGR